MRLEASLHMRHEMRMRLAPQIIQSIEILQLPLIELRARIDEELLENALLEQADAPERTEAEDAEDASEDRAEEQPRTAEEAPAEPVAEEAVPEVTADSSANKDEQMQRLDDLTRYYDDFGEGGYRPTRPSGERDAKMEAFENSPGPDITLAEHLTRQLAYIEIDAETRPICENIIANLDGRGYLVGTLEEIIAPMGKQVGVAQAENALAVVQGLEPPGVAARSLEECLVLQLDPREKGYVFLSNLITGHFDDIIHNRYPKVAHAMGCAVHELTAAVEKIGALNPNPGSLFEVKAVPHVMPDLGIEEVDGEYTVILNNTWLPPLRISAYYARRLQETDLDPKTREYMQKKLQSAQGLIAAIEQRRTTVFRVATEIVKAQKDFFDKGGMHLKPLKMQDVADKVGVHVSTVSRAISDKYAQTPRGIFSLKYFFTGGLTKQDGEEESWEVVRQKLLNIVAHEDKTNPMSDEHLAGELTRQGIEIARRTVSKYRKTLGIPSSRQRKQY